MCILEAGMCTAKRRLGMMGVVVLLVSSGCSGNGDGSHTTATTFVSPPPRQMLKAEFRPAKQVAALPDDVETKDPLLIFDLPDGKTFHEGEAVVIDFSLANAKLKGEGGEYRVRYIVDDDDMKWIDRSAQVVLTGWIPGKHTIRLELIGPDGWPYRNNILTREITVVK